MKLKGIYVVMVVTFIIFLTVSSTLGADPIKFGVSTAISGDAASYGKPFLDAIIMMANSFNEEGGVLGRKIEVIYYDDKGVPDHALENSKKLVYQDKVHTLQPGSTSGCIMTGMPAGKEAKVAMWGYGLAKDWLLAGEGMIWRSAPPDMVMIDALAQFAYKSKGIKTVGILYLDTFYGETSRDVFTDRFTKLGGKVIKATSYTDGDRDFSSQYMTLSRAKPDALYLVAQGGAAAPALRQARQFLGEDVIIISDNNWNNLNIRQEAGDVANGIYYYSQSAVWVNPDPFVQKWMSRAKEKIGYYTGIMARALVGMEIMKTALERAKTTDALAVMKEVHKMKSVPTVMGPYTYDPRDGEGVKTGIVLTPTAGADLAKDQVVFTSTLKDALYENTINYDRFFGEGYYQKLLEYHGLK